MENNIVSLDRASFDTAFLQALSGIKERISGISAETAAFSPQLAYLKHLSEMGLDELTYWPERSGETDSFEFSFLKKHILLSDRFRVGWMDMFRGSNLLADNTSGRAFEVLRDSVENFILHELFHRDQELTTEQHEDYRSAPNVGRVIDYFADASAILSAALLHSEYDRSFEYIQWRTLYVRFARAALRQFYAFVRMDRAGEGGQSPIAERGTDWRLNVFNRHLVWHYQYHRLSMFRLSAHVDQVQLLFEPGISLRFMHDIDWDGRRPPINETWPDHEERTLVGARALRAGLTPTQSQHTTYRLSSRANLDRDHFILAAPNFWGIPKIYRFSPSASPSDIYRQLFEGVIAGDTEKTKPFFSALFGDSRFRPLIGYSWLPPGGPTGPGAPRSDSPNVEDNVQLDNSAPKLFRYAGECAKDFGDRRFIPARASLLKTYPHPPAELHGEG